MTSLHTYFLWQSFVVTVIVKFSSDFISIISIYFQCASFAITLKSFNQQHEELEEEELLLDSKWLFTSLMCANFLESIS